MSDDDGVLTAEPPSDLAAKKGRRLARRATWMLRLALILANLFGAVTVYVLAVWVLPSANVGDADPADLAILNLVLGLAYVAVALPLGLVIAQRRIRPALDWLRTGRIPDSREVRIAQRAPLRMLTVQAVLWAIAAVLFTIVDGLQSPWLIPRAAFTISLGGVTVCSITYLLSERILRPVVTIALGHAGDMSQARTPGVTTRAMLTWALGPGVLTFGLTMIGLFALVEPDDEASTEALRTEIVQLSVAMIVLGTLGLVLGSLTTLLGARSIAAPVRSVRVALGRVERGDLDVHIGVYDGSELGRLQAGFNRMVAGLREREQLRVLFGRHVGEDVAREALARGPEFGGETLEVAVLFVDLVGSTTLATDRPPDEVLALLNRFFSVVVEAVDHHGGWINKFQGDAALAIFGAPATLADPAGAALATGRELAERLPVAVPECAAGIGIAFGSVVAGNLGDERRYEYTVIGDPVNVAARLTELAKHERPMLLTTGATVVAAAAASAVADPGGEAGGEASCWEVGDEVPLRGRPEPLRLARPKT